MRRINFIYTRSTVQSRVFCFNVLQCFTKHSEMAGQLPGRAWLNWLRPGMVLPWWVSAFRLTFDRALCPIGLFLHDLFPKLASRRPTVRLNEDTNELEPSGWCEGGKSVRALTRAVQTGQWVRACWNYSNVSQFGWVLIDRLYYQKKDDMNPGVPTQEGLPHLTVQEFKNLACFAQCPGDTDVLVIEWSCGGFVVCDESNPIPPCPTGRPRSLPLELALRMDDDDSDGSPLKMPGSTEGPAGPEGRVGHVTTSADSTPVPRRLHLGTPPRRTQEDTTKSSNGVALVSLSKKEMTDIGAPKGQVIFGPLEHQDIKGDVKGFYTAQGFGVRIDGKDLSVAVGDLVTIKKSAKPK